MHIRYLGAMMLIILSFSVNVRAATATCHCQLGIEPGPGELTLLDFPGVDLTGDAALSFSGAVVFTPANNGDCKKKCEKTFDDGTGKVAAGLCTKYRNNIQDIPKKAANLYYWLGGKPPYFIKRIGRIGYEPAKKTVRYTCPANWAANETNVAGGVTLQGVCKKEAGALGFSPPPPDGTPIGNWGFVWAGKAIAYGTAANGGAPSVEVLTDIPEKCGFY